MTKKYKILVLSDVDNSPEGILKNGINLAKIVGGNIDILCVKKPTEIIKKESQLSAMRTINEKFLEMDNKMKNVIAAQSKDNSITIQHKIAFGNLKDEISSHLNNTKPDLIVLGNSKSKIFSFLGDKIIDFLLKEFKGTIMIASDKTTLEPNSELSLGLLNDTSNPNENNFKEALISFSTKPIKSFHIDSKKPRENKFSKSKQPVEFVFENGNNAIKNMGNYLSKNNVQLLFANREKNKISALSSALDCSLLLTE